MTPFPYKSYKKTSFVSGCIPFVYRLYTLVEAYFPGTTRLIIVAYNNVKSMFLAVVGRKNTELQRSYKGEILYNLYIALF